MYFQVSTYRTLSGVKKIVEIPRKKETQWVIYENNKPKYYVDFFDLENESNSMMNSLVLCGKRSLDEVLEILNKRNNINLSIPRVSRFGIKKKIKSELKKIDLAPLPENWLAYSL